MQVFLIRHPRPVLATGVCYGRLDVAPHDVKGVARSVRAQLPPGIAIVSSPLRRARELALALDPAARIDARLAEMNFGQWEGRRWDDVERADLDAWAANLMDFAAPGGESTRELQQRAVDFAGSLAGERVALVTHAGVMRALVGHWRKLSPVEWTQLQFEFGSVTAIEIETKQESAALRQTTGSY